MTGICFFGLHRCVTPLNGKTIKTASIYRRNFQFLPENAGFIKVYDDQHFQMVNVFFYCVSVYPQRPRTSPGITIPVNMGRKLFLPFM